MRDRREPVDPVRLRVDPVACAGIGMCAHLAPGLIVLDRWGYPIIAGAPTRAADMRAARAATVGCPRRALLLESIDSSAGTGNPYGQLGRRSAVRVEGVAGDLRRS